MSRWQHQWLRALRWYERTAGAWQAASIDDIEGFVFSTWQNVWHVYDYLNTDPESRQAILGSPGGRSLYSRVQADPRLVLVKDLANVSKHAELRHQWRHEGLHVGGLGHAGWVGDGGVENPDVVWLYVRWENAEGPGVPALLPAYDGLHAWRSLFRELGVQWDSRQPGVEWPQFAEPPSQQPRRGPSRY